METDGIYRIENTLTFNRINNQEIIENGDLVDTDTDMEHGTVNDNEELENNTNKNRTTMISETKQYDEVIYKKLILMLLKRQIKKLRILLKLHNCNWIMK